MQREQLLNKAMKFCGFATQSVVQLNQNVVGRSSDKVIAMANKSLDRELDTFRRVLPDLLKDQNKYALIWGEKVLGVYESYGDALKDGYEKAGLEPFLVKKIAGIETIGNFSRDLSVAACQV